ncbi:MAG: ferritin [Planctomycetes bacterium]|nr:ferritin [Planctomycetota bacterium]NOG54652.1 ferritin [Planctomycetota bacterium]
MLSATLQAAFNDQINFELASAYVYLAMSAHFDESSLPGCAKWMKHQAEEEVGHAMRLLEYVHDRGSSVALGAIPAPTGDFGTPRDTFQQALEHEQAVTARIHKMYELAQSEKDYATVSHLRWFIDEQVEEESSAGEIIAMFDLAGQNPGALLTIDGRLGARE